MRRARPAPGNALQRAAEPPPPAATQVARARLTQMLTRRQQKELAGAYDGGTPAQSSGSYGTGGYSPPIV